MLSGLGNRGRLPLAMFAFCLAALASPASPQTSPQEKPAEVANAPLPDVPTLMAQVRAHQQAMDAIQENYTFHETDITQMLNKMAL